MTVSLAEVLWNWRSEELHNLCSLLGIEQSCSLESIQGRIKWLYHSKARASAESAVRNLGMRIFSRLSKSKRDLAVKRDDLREVPTYDALIVGACKHLEAFEPRAPLAELEVFLSHAVILAALQKMRPRERVKFFEHQIDPTAILPKAQIKGATLGGPAATFALLGTAQASGFGVYLASTTALGFLTHAVGVTLPFVVYTGMTGTIAYLIGPVGWLTAGMWGAWKLTEPAWKKLIPALIYIVATNSRKDLENSD